MMGGYEMMDYLTETYNGDVHNMLSNASYYCYTLFDIETGKYYSGSRGIEGRNTHDLLHTYYTSSTVIDFKNKLKLHPELFTYRIEYFNSRMDAFNAEKQFHIKHQVGKNPLFINSATAGGSNCGAGSVLCKDDDGKTYRVTVEEFSTGKHVHVSQGMMNIRTDTGIKKIYKTEYDKDFHTTEFEDYVLAIDKISNKSCKIPKSVFYSDPRYVGITKGIVVAYDTIDKVTVSVTSDIFKNSNGRYVGITSGMMPVIERKTGIKKMIKIADYDKEVYSHPNEGMMVVYSLFERKIVSISKQEYTNNIENYVNQSTKCFYKVDGIFFKSKKELDIYYKKTRNRSVLKVTQFDISNKFSDIEIITREEYGNGKN